MLNTQWSPQQISARLPVDYPDDPEMRVSHETIYRSLFVHPGGVAHHRVSAVRTRRRPHGRKDPGGYIKEIPHRGSTQIEDRAVPGEGDLMLGVRVGDRHVGRASDPLRDVTQDESMCARSSRRRSALPQHLAVSLTWDRGKEMAGHFSMATGVHVYFCDPSSPWRNENTTAASVRCQSIASGT